MTGCERKRGGRKNVIILLDHFTAIRTYDNRLPALLTPQKLKHSIISGPFISPRPRRSAGGPSEPMKNCRLVASQCRPGCRKDVYRKPIGHATTAAKEIIYYQTEPSYNFIIILYTHFALPAISCSLFLRRSALQSDALTGRRRRRRRPFVGKISQEIASAVRGGRACEQQTTLRAPTRLGWGER